MTAKGANPFGKPGKEDDSSIEVDLGNVSSGFKIDAGNYPGRCIGVEKGISKAGNPQLIWSFAITGKKYPGREFKMWTALTPQALWKVAEVIEALGLGTKGSVAKFAPKDAIGKPCALVIKDDEYNGEERSSLDKVLAGEEPKRSANSPVLAGKTSKREAESDQDD